MVLLQLLHHLLVRGLHLRQAALTRFLWARGRELMRLHSLEACLEPGSLPFCDRIPYLPPPPPTSPHPQTSPAPLRLQALQQLPICRTKSGSRSPISAWPGTAKQRHSYETSSWDGERAHQVQACRSFPRSRSRMEGENRLQGAVF